MKKGVVAESMQPTLPKKNRNPQSTAMDQTQENDKKTELPMFDDLEDAPDVKLSFTDEHDAGAFVKTMLLTHDYESMREAVDTIMEHLDDNGRNLMLRALLNKEVKRRGVKERVPDDMNKLSPHWREGEYPYVNRMSYPLYEKEKYHLQVELLKLQRWVKETGRKIVILFEGRDAAGKGGTIRRFMEHLNPRGARVVALPKPSDVEAGQWYFQRYVAHLPTKGEIVFFDRSWYNRAGVEPVMGFCTKEEYENFMREVPDFERSLIRSGITLIKFWFAVSREEQLKRFREREVHPLKHWKLSPIDRASIDRWNDYTRASQQMFNRTDTADAPWIIIKSDDKLRARLNAIRVLLHTVEYEDRDLKAVGEIDPLIVARASTVCDTAPTQARTATITTIRRARKRRRTTTRRGRTRRRERRSEPFLRSKETSRASKVREAFFY